MIVKKIQNCHCTADGSVLNLKIEKVCTFPAIVMVEQLGRVPLGHKI